MRNRSKLKMPMRKVAGFAALLALTVAPQRCDLGKWQRHRAGLLRRAAQHYEKRRHARAERAFAQVHPIIQRTFDISAMVRLSVEPFWTTLSQTERQ